MMSQELGIFSTPYGDFIKTFESKPGIMVDIPPIASPCFVDGNWTRFDNGQPRKFGGMKKVITGSADIVRQMFIVSLGTLKRVFLFRNSGLFQTDYNSQNNTWSSEVNRTPPGYEPPTLEEESFVFSVTAFSKKNAGFNTSVYLFYVGTPTAKDICSDIQKPVYTGLVAAADPFGELPVATSGGVITVGDFLIIYGSNGLFLWSEPGNPFVIPNGTVFGYQKIIAARNLGTGLIIWTPTKLKNVTYDPSLNIFVETTLSDSISILSPSSIINGNNNTFYWCGLKQFYYWNGAVNALPNPFNRNYFYKNLNMNYAGQVWGMYVEDFTELWWFAPTGISKECNKLYIYDTTSHDWSYTDLKRSCGVMASADALKNPILADSSTENIINTGTAMVWLHEVGYDVEINDASYPISSFYQTKWFSMFSDSQQTNLQMRLSRVEKNFSQVGDMTLIVLVKDFPDSEPYVYQQLTFTPETTSLDINITGRFVSFKYTSDALNGFFQGGTTFIDYRPDSQRPSG